MKVLVVHNAYQQRGGEDSVVESEIALLRQHGHEVEAYIRHNDEVTGQSRVSLAMQTLWSSRSVDDMGRLAEAFRPDVVHVHNTLPLVSPSVFWAAHRLGVPVVQTLHNFRLMCPQAMFLRNGKVCEDCLGHVPILGVARACYRESVVQTAVLGASVTWHRAIGTFDKAITSFIALSEFSRGKFIQGGLPAGRIAVKPNFVEDAGRPDDTMSRTGGLFVGRLSHEKGIDVLLAAREGGVAYPLEVVGSGEMEPAVRAGLGEGFVGYQPLGDILARMRRAAFLVMPSLCYENFPRSIAEAYSSGLPVVASRLGAMAELVEDGRTGLLFEPGNAQDLKAKMDWAHANPDRMREMGRHAREVYEKKYTPAINHDSLTAIYRQAIDRVRGQA